VLLLCPTHV